MHKQIERYQQNNVNLLTWLKGPHDIIGKWKDWIWLNSVTIYWLSLHHPARQCGMNENRRQSLCTRRGYTFPGGEGGPGAITHREAHKALVQRWRKNTSFQVSWLGRAGSRCLNNVVKAWTSLSRICPPLLWLHPRQDQLWGGRR